MDIDAIDHRILDALRQDAGQPNTALADRVGLSPSACLRRVQRLKKAGIIEGIHARIAPAVYGKNLAAIVLVELERDGPSYRKKLADRLRKEPAVTQAYMVTGTVSVIVHMQIFDMDEFSNLADKLFHADSNVRTFTTHIVMSTEKLSLP